MPRPLRAVLVLVCLSISASPAMMAQEADTLSPSSIISPKAAPLIPPTEEMFLSGTASGMRLSDALRRFTGVQLKDYGGAGGLKTINVRSLGSEHTGIFLDGIQIENAQNMQVDLGRFSSDELSAIALYNAPKSVRLQTAREYAAGAAVHLDTAPPSETRGKLRLRGGSMGTFNPEVLADFRIGKVGIRSAAEYLRSNGRYRYPYFDTTLVRENADIRRLRLSTVLSGVLKSGLWNLRLHAHGSEQGFPGPVIRRGTGLPFSSERQADRDFFVQGCWKEEWTARYGTALRFKYADAYTHYNTHPEKNPMALPYNLHYRERSAYLSFAQAYSISPLWGVGFSLDGQQQHLRKDSGAKASPRRRSLFAALSTDLKGEKLRASAQLVYTAAWDRYEEKAFRSAWMSAFSMDYTPLPFLETDAFIKRTYRLPSFNDLYYQQIGNAALVPESAFQAGWDLRVHGRRRHVHAEGRLSPYYNRVSNKIVAIPTYSQFRWSMLNIGIVDITGMDVKGSAGWTAEGWRLDLTGRYSFQRAIDHSDPKSLVYGNQIPYIPLHSGSVDIEAGKGPWTVGLNGFFSGGKWSRTANIPDYYIRPWSTFDASLLFRRESRPLLQAGLRVQNLFNTHYSIVQGYPMPGTTALLTLEYTW